jgi:hypothetical protein
MTNISPIFFIETLADLEKSPRKNRPSTKEVQIIANKTPEMHANPNAFHITLIIGNLLGYDVAMEGRMVLSGGRQIMTGDKQAVMFELPPEREAFERWQNEEFFELERQFARAWRRLVGPLNFALLLQIFTAAGVKPKSHSLEEAQLVANKILSLKDNQKTLLLIGCELFHIPNHIKQKIVARWDLQRDASLKDFAPYFFFCLNIDLFFYITLCSDLVPQEFNTKSDFAYLYYLPFCMVFTSSDKVHKRCAKFFLRADQRFVWGPELKDDLSKINIHFDSLPDAEKEQGLFKIAVYPPDQLDTPIISRLYDEFLPSWRAHKKEAPIIRTKEEEKKLVNEIVGMKDGTPVPYANRIDSDALDAMIITHRIRKRKGKWWQLPKNLGDDTH